MKRLRIFGSFVVLLMFMSAVYLWTLIVWALQ
jgi:hypothetical protein